MSFLKAAFGLSGADRVAKRIIRDGQIRKAKGEDADFWAEYSQREIGIRLNASLAGGLVARKLKKSGFSIVKVQASGKYGDSVRLLVRIPCEGSSSTRIADR
jgi:hypothetical protein